MNDGTITSSGTANLKRLSKGLHPQSRGKSPTAAVHTTDISNYLSQGAGDPNDAKDFKFSEALNQAIDEVNPAEFPKEQEDPHEDSQNQYK